MKKTGTIFLAVLGTVIASNSAANASSSACRSIADPMKRLACYDKAASVATASGKTAAAKPVQGPVFNPIPLKTKADVPSPGPRFWAEVEGGVYGFSKNMSVLAATTPPATTGPTFVPSAPGFIGLVSISTVTNPLATADPARLGGGGSYRMGYWLDPERTMAVDGSVFFVRGTSKFDLSGAPTTARTTTFINTTPDVFVGLFDDTTTTTLNGAISDQLYGADVNYRITAPHLTSLSNFDIMVGARYVALEEKLAASVNSLFTRNYQPSLGLPGVVDFSNSVSGTDSFRIRNDFIGPQVGFDAEQHWGRYWVASENKLAVGAVIEGLSVSGVNVSSITPTKTLMLAGIPIAVNAGAPPVTGASANPPFGLFGQGDRSKTVFAVVPSGSIKAGYDINDMVSLTVAYNYLYMSGVGRIGDQVASPSDIRQSGFFAQGITFGAKARF